MGNVPHGPIDLTPIEVCDQLEEELTPTTPTGGVSGGFAWCMQSTGYSVGNKMYGPAAGSLQTLTGGDGDVMQALGLMAAAHPVEVVCQHTLGCQDAQATLGHHSPLGREGSTLLGVPTTPVTGNTAWTSDLLRHAVHGHIPDGMGGGGGYLPRESGWWSAASGGGPTHQPPWAPGGVLGPPALQAPDTRKARAGEDWRLHHGGLHQQTRRSSVHCPVGNNREPVVVGLRAPVVSDGSPHSGTGEQGYRLCHTSRGFTRGGKAD